MRTDSGALSLGMRLADESSVTLAIRRLKVNAHRARRLFAWLHQPEQWPVLPSASPHDFPELHYRRTVPIGRTDAGADPVLEAGKKLNLALAAPAFHGRVCRPEQPLSFWRTLGAATAARGFRYGMELRGGCIVPTVGGGLCLLSNELFRAASLTGWTIIERHGHSLQAAPPADDAIWGLDATVFWPYVDLRVAPRRAPAWLGVTIRDEQLTIELRGHTPLDLSARLEEEARSETGAERANRIVRTLVDNAHGQVVAQDVIAENRKRLLVASEQRRNCLTCAEVDCRARPRGLPASK